eukprot:3171756-Rhodomonas_salina.2
MLLGAETRAAGRGAFTAQGWLAWVPIPIPRSTLLLPSWADQCAPRGDVEEFHFDPLNLEIRAWKAKDVKLLNAALSSISSTLR